MRVPVEDGSLTDLTVVLDRAVHAEGIDAAHRKAAEEPLKDVGKGSPAHRSSRGTWSVTPPPASWTPRSPRTHGDLVKVFGWYDNE